MRSIAAVVPGRLDPILADTGLSRVYISTLYALGTAVSAAMVVLVARLADRFGARLMLAVIAFALAGSRDRLRWS